MSDTRSSRKPQNLESENHTNRHAGRSRIRRVLLVSARACGIYGDTPGSGFEATVFGSLWGYGNQSVGLSLLAKVWTPNAILWSDGRRSTTVLIATNVRSLSEVLKHARGFAEPETGLGFDADAAARNALESFDWLERDVDVHSDTRSSARSSVRNGKGGAK